MSNYNAKPQTVANYVGQAADLMTKALAAAAKCDALADATFTEMRRAYKTLRHLRRKIKQP